MSIEFKCTCGKVLRAPENMAGKQARCPACQSAVLVPEALALLDDKPDEAPSQNASTIPCPNCGTVLSAGAAICPACGFNTQTSSIPPPTRAAAKRSGGPSIGLPIKKTITAAVVVALLAVGWFGFVSPMLGKIAIASAKGYVTNGDLEKGLTAFQDLHESTSGAERDRVDLMVAQLSLELDHNSGSVLGKGTLVNSDSVEMSVGKRPGAPGGAVLFRLKITNNSGEPLTISNDHFYLRGLSDVVFVATHTENSLDGVVAAPGATAEGIVAFRKMPNHPVRRQIGRYEQTNYYIMFNTGHTYVKRMLPF